MLSETQSVQVLADPIPEHQIHCQCGARLTYPETLFDDRTLEKCDRLDLDVQTLIADHGGRHVWFCIFCEGVTIRRSSNGPIRSYAPR